MISSICWLPRGAAKPVPAPAALTQEELAVMRQEAADMAAGVLQGSEDDAEELSSGWETEAEEEEMDVEAAVAKARAAAQAISANSRKVADGGSSGRSQGKAAAGSLEAALAELDMEHYDDSEDDVDADGEGLGGIQSGEGHASASVINRALGGSCAGIILDDPYMQGDDSSDEADDDQGLSDMDSEERDDYVLRSSDLLLLAARNEDDVSTIEVWVYEEASSSTGGEANIYVHHDILLPAFPLSLAWMDFSTAPSAAGNQGNMVAVGSMDPGIEIWDLDIADQVEPVVTLGGVADQSNAAPIAAEAAAAAGKSKNAKHKAKQKAKKKAQQQQQQLKAGSHSGAVMSLSWNKEFRNVLASGSADSTVKVWDLAAGQCEHTLTHHSDKVQAVAWNPAEPPVLLSGSYDRTACLVDVRTPAGQVLRWSVSADVEALGWNPSSPTSFLVSSEDGLVVSCDARAGGGSGPLFKLSAHNKPTCALSFCPQAPGLLATASTDKVAKLWDVANNQPCLLATQEPKLGAIFSATFCQDVPYLLAMAGAKGSVGVWDVRNSAQVAAKFPQLFKDVADQ